MSTTRFLAKAGRTVGLSIDAVIQATIYPIALFLLGIVSIISYDVTARYVFNAPTEWAFAYSQYFFIWFSFIAVAYVQNKNRHVQVDLLTVHLPERALSLWRIVILSLFLLFACVVCYFGALYAFHSYLTGETGWSVLQVRIWWVKAALPVGMFLLVLCLIRQIASEADIYLFGDLDEGGGFLSNQYLVVALLLALIFGCLLVAVQLGTMGIIALMFALLFLGVPIFPALGLTGFAGFYFIFGGWSSVGALGIPVAYDSLNNFALVCLPLFILTGQVLQASGVGEELYEFISKWTSFFPSSEGVATIFACAIFAAISTSSVATLVTIGLIALPALKYYKYDEKHSYGLLAAGGTLGLMIPPSGAMIIYSAVTEESLGKLFLAGLIPGIILVLLFALYTVIYSSVGSRAKIGKKVGTRNVNWVERIASLRIAVWGLGAPLVIMGGIYSGVFTPLESGAIAAVYVILMVLVRRKITIRMFPSIIAESSLSSVMVISIIVGALIFGDFITLIRAPNILISAVASWHVDRFYILLVLLGMYLILGLFLEVVSCMLITLPIVYPLVTTELGYSGIWFAVILTLTMEMAVITPPVGLNLYALMGISDAKLSDILYGVFPFFLIMLFAVGIFIAFPEFSLWLPSVAIGG